MAGTGPELGSVAQRPSVALVQRPDAPLPWAVGTDPGPLREHNEDSWRIDETHGVFALADGMGGYKAGEVASEIAVRTVTELTGALCEAGLAVADALCRAVAAAHAGIVEFAHARPECLGMGTTLVAAAIGGGQLTLVHVGDSRAYLLRDGRLSRLTVDHSLGQQMLAEGRLTEAQVRRVPARGILTRALGVAAEAPLPDLSVHRWCDGDLLMLCSDGLSDPLEDAAIATVLASGRDNLATCVRELVVAALSRGGTDNATVLLVASAGGRSSTH
jgi:serine/threonine protein phosphatase PrpC